VDHHAVLDVFSDFEVSDFWEKAAWDFLWEALFLVVWVVDGHVEDRFLEPLVFAPWVCEDHQCFPGLEAFGC
jgi:hypothetical protein